MFELGILFYAFPGFVLWFLSIHDQLRHPTFRGPVDFLLSILCSAVLCALWPLVIYSDHMEGRE